eukprot:2722284-Rhodomonas_salina.3
MLWIAQVFCFWTDQNPPFLLSPSLVFQFLNPCNTTLKRSCIAHQASVLDARVLCYPSTCRSQMHATHPPSRQYFSDRTGFIGVHSTVSVPHLDTI